MIFPSYIYFLKKEKLLGINSLSILTFLIIILFSIEKGLNFTNLFSSKSDIFTTIITCIFASIIPLISYCLSIILWYKEQFYKLSNEDYKNTTDKKINSISKQLHRIETKINSENLNKNCYQKKFEKDKNNNPDNIQSNEKKLPFDTLNLGDNRNQILPNWDLLLKALNFPNDVNDEIGFKALKLAKKHKKTKELLLSAEDVMTLFSKKGVYLDDHKFSPLNNKNWVEFLSDENINQKKLLVCLGHEKLIEILNKEDINDTIFRDTMLTFLRRFDQFIRHRYLSAHEDQLSQLAFTRSGKAFILIGKLYKIF